MPHLYDQHSGYAESGVIVLREELQKAPCDPVS